MLPKKIFSNENFSVLVSEGIVNRWNEFELIRYNFAKSKNGIVRSLKQFNTYFSNEINMELSKIDSKIIFSKLDYSTKYNKNKFKILCDYLKINKYENEDYKCEFCEVPRFNLNWCHIIKRGMSNKKFDRCVLNYLFMCGNCHDDTEKPYWNEIKNRKFYKNQMRKLINKRKRVNKQLLKFLKSDVSRYMRLIKLIENIKKEIKNYKEQDKRLKDDFNKIRKELNNELQQKKSKIAREIEKLIREIRKRYNSRINKIRKKYVNPKIKDKRINKIKTQKNKDINKKEKDKKEKCKKLDEIKNRRIGKLDKHGYKLFTALYEKFKDRIRKMVRDI